VVRDRSSSCDGRNNVSALHICHDRGHTIPIRPVLDATIRGWFAERRGTRALKTDRDCNSYNAGKPYRERIRPGGFLISFPAKNRARLPKAHQEAIDRQGGAGISPYAPFDRDPNVAATKCFNRKTGRAVAIDELQTYAEALRYFHLRPEDKYDNARFLDSGITERKRVVPLWIDVVGKETKRFATEDPYVFEGEYEPTEYGSIPATTFLRIAMAMRLTSVEVGYAYTPNQMLEIKARLEEHLRKDEMDLDLVARVRAACELCGGLRRLAAIADVDPGDLSKVLAGKRRLTNHLRRQLRGVDSSALRKPPD